MRSALELRSARWPLRASARFVDPYMAPAYRWMARELARKVGPPPRGVRFPLWAWVEKPDLRTAAHLPRGARGALLELEVARSRVLISDFERFHAVLNRHYLARDAEDDERFDRHAAGGRRARIRKSWRRIFSLASSVRDPDYWGPVAEAALQAVFWELPREAVLSVREFSAR